MFYKALLLVAPNDSYTVLGPLQDKPVRYRGETFQCLVLLKNTFSTILDEEGSIFHVANEENCYWDTNHMLPF